MGILITARHISIYLTCLAGLLGILVIIGWHLRLAALIQIRQSYVPMQYNTAVGMVLMSAALLFLVRDYRRVAFALSAFAIFFSLLILAQYALDKDFGVDQSLMEHYITLKTSHPGRPAPNTAVCFLLLGTSISFMAAGPRVRIHSLAGTIPATVVLAMGAASLLGYATGIRTTYGWGDFTRMALHAALGFIVLGIAALAVAWERSATRPNQIPDWIPISSAICVLMMTVLLWQALVELRDTPESQFLLELRSISRAVLLGGTIIAALLSLALMLARKSRQRTREAEEANRRLRDEIRQRELIAEELHRKSRELAAAQRIARLGTWVWSIPENRVYASGEYLRALGLRPEDSSLDLDGILSHVHEEDREPFHQKVRESLNSGSPFESEHRIIFSDGSVRFHSASGDVVVDKDGNPLRMILTVLDITESKRAEERIRDSLEQKEVLLKEIYHRVKNNLQIVSSLLSLQSSSVDDPRAAELLMESRNRIVSMALVHEKLYQSEDMARIDAREYLLGLSHRLRTTYDLKASVHAMETDLDPARLDLDTAVPLGLILNELITNAIKHAFPDGRRGTMLVRFKLAAGDRYVLTVRDDGIGLGLGFALESCKTLGLRLVRALAEQLNAELIVSRGAGCTEFVVSFPIPRSHPEEVL